MRDHLRSRQLLRRHAHCGARYRLAAAKRAGRHHCRAKVAVSVVDVTHIDVSHVGDICNIRDVGHVPDVGNVNLAQVVSLIVVPRDERIARAKREPRGYSAEAEAERETAATYESNQGRSIYGHHRHGAGHPAPPFADKGPPPIVEGAEAPRFLFYPGPAPGFNPSPMAEAIRHPAHRDARRVPHGTVFWDL